MLNSRKIFTIDSINKRLFFPILTGISHVMIRTGNQIIKNCRIKSKNTIEDHPVIMNSLMFLSEIFTIILFLIELYRSKSKHQTVKKKLKMITIIKVCALILLVSILDNIASFALKIVRQDSPFLELIYKLLVMGLTAILSIFMLHMKYYSSCDWLYYNTYRSFYLWNIIK